MKQQVARLSPHQNAKVFAVLTALSSLVLLVPFFLMFAGFGPAQSRPPLFLMLLMPVLYLVFGYVVTIIACALYNLMFRYIGGIEFESTSSPP
jgi:hypothetical protein